MTLRLTPGILASMYRFLCATPPFKRWKLPHSDEVKFRVMVSDQWRGQHSFENGQHTIDISAKKHGHTMTTLVTMAHEMVHAKVAEDGEDKGAEHGPAFKRRAKLVCKHHGFDPKEF